MFLFSAFISGLLLMVLRRTTLPVGAITLILGLDGVAIITAGSRNTPISAQLSFIAVAVAAGVVGDTLLWRIRPYAARPLGLRTIAAAVPVTYFVLYLGVVGSGTDLAGRRRSSRGRLCCAGWSGCCSVSSRCRRLSSPSFPAGRARCRKDAALAMRSRAAAGRRPRACSKR